MPVTIRLAVNSDASDMAEIGARSWEAAYKNILPERYIREKNARRLEQFTNSITDKNEDAYVIQKNGKTIGIMKIAATADDDLTRDYFELHYIYLHPDHFRRGIGTEAMDFAFKKAREAGKKFISVWVFAENINSIRFYEKCGFVPDGKFKLQDRGGPVKVIRMKRKL